MRFALTDDQRFIQEAAREGLQRVCPPSRVRAAWSGGPDGDLWAALAGLGVFGVHLPESVGGMGLGALELVLVLEEVGRAAAPGPVLEAAVAGWLLSRVGARRGVSASAVIDGEMRATVGFGREGFALDADRSDVILMERGGELHAIAPKEAALRRRESVDRSRRLFEVELGARVAEVQDAAVPCAGAWALGVIGASAELIGLGRRMLDMAVEYASARRQFGQPVGSFQAVQHALADALIGIDFARPLVWRAAWAVDRGDASAEAAAEVGLWASSAKARASEAAMGAARAALQAHGAMGYTTEVDLHLWMKRAWALSSSWGGAGWHMDRVADALLGSGEGAGPG